MISAIILEEDAFEHIIKWNREEEFEMDGFEMESCERNGNKINWRMKHEPDSDYVWCGAIGRLPTFLGMKDAVEFKGQGISLQPGDVFYLSYEIVWWWEGRQDDEYVRLPTPTPGAKLVMEFSLCA